MSNNGTSKIPIPEALSVAASSLLATTSSILGNLSDFTINNGTTNGSNSNNTFMAEHQRELSVHFSIAFGSVLCAVTTIGISANALVALAVLSDRKMRRTPMNLLLLNLAIADLLYLLSFCPFWLSMTLYGDRGWHLPDQFCPLARFLCNAFLVISILSYVAICVERYVAIVHPMNAAVWCTRSRITLMALGIWAFAFAYQFPYLALFRTLALPNNSNLRVCRNPLAVKSVAWRLYKWSEFGLTYVIPIVLSVLMYSRICRVLWHSNGLLNQKRTNRVGGGTSTLQYRPSGGMIKRMLETRLKETIAEIQSTNSHSTSSSDGSSTINSRGSSNSTTKSATTCPNKLSNGPSANLCARRSVVKMLMLCVGLFFCCYTPMVAYFLWGALFGRPLPLPFEFVLVTSTLLQFQSAFNPFLYTLFATHFREKLTKLALFCCCCCTAEGRRELRRKQWKFGRGGGAEDGGIGGGGEGEHHKGSAKSTLSSSID